MVSTCISENIRRIAAQKGFKHNAVAQKAGLSEQQFSSLLNGRRLIKDCDVVAIANALGVTPNDLFGISSQGST